MLSYSFLNLPHKLAKKKILNHGNYSQNDCIHKNTVHCPEELHIYYVKIQTMYIKSAHFTSDILIAAPGK